MEQNVSAVPEEAVFDEVLIEVQNTLLIIDKMDINIEAEILGLVQSLCSDINYFFDKQKPEYYPVYASHALRELIEKFFLPNEYYLPEESVEVSLEEALVEKINNLRLTCFESVSTNEIKIKSLLKIPDRDALLRLSCDEPWHNLVWKLNDLYGGTESNIAKFKAQHFVEQISSKYSMDTITRESLLKQRKDHYSSLSDYSHLRSKRNTPISALIEILNKPAEERSQEDKDFLNEYIDTITGALALFKNFEFTTTDKIKELEKIIND